MDNLGAMRLFAATLVLFGHSYAITGRPAPTWFGTEVHVFAVRIFFVISGYLIAGSWLRDPHVGRFLIRRALRIMPALVVAVVVTVLILGPLASRFGIGAYFAAPETRLYLWNAALAPYFVLPGVFDDGRPFTAVNGSLWSLPVEVLMYMLLPGYVLTRPGRVGRIAVGVAAAVSLGGAFWFTTVRPDVVEPVVYWTSLPFAARFASDFVLGAAVRVAALERFLDLQWALVLVVLAGSLAFHPWAMAAAGLAVAPYVVLAWGLAAPPVLGGIGRRTDISYGVYLWACPVQQLGVSLMGPTVEPLVLTAMSVPAAYVLGWVSWHALERHALRLKPGWRPGAMTDVRGVVKPSLHD